MGERFFPIMQRFMCVPNDNPELTLAQFRAMSKHVPLLYLVLSINLLALSYTHYELAPHWLCLFAPAVILPITSLRAIQWFVARADVVDAQTAYRRLKVANFLAAPIALFFVVWSLSLLPYGDAYHKAHVAFFISITVIGCISSLMHLRSAALIVTFIVNAAIFIFMLGSGNHVLMAMGLNVALVTICMASMLMSHYRDFSQLHESRQELLEKTKALQDMSDENGRLANLDSLTLIANRRRFFELLGIMEAKAQQTNMAFSVAVLDLDGFKPVNDVHGHGAGDQLLVEIARRLQNMSSGRFEVARLGGDEFAFIFHGVVADEAVNALGAEICAAVSAPVRVGAGSVHVTGSMGLASFPRDGEMAQDVYEKADYALYNAKKQRRGGAVAFNKAQALQMSQSKAIEEAFLAADLHHEFYLVYQPIMDIDQASCIGFEALARWKSPIVGMVPPSEFIPIAEHSGRMGLLTRYLLQKALLTAATWPKGNKLSFNLSAHDLMATDTVARLIALVEISQIEPESVFFEITETSMLQDFDQARQSIEMLHRAGIGVALDDFGTGYSSLGYLHRLPLTKLKIDRSFVRDLDNCTISQNIVRSVLALSQDMGLDVIVEGVETQGQLSALSHMGAKLVQGYFYSMPLSAEDAYAWVSKISAQQKSQTIAISA